MNPFKHKQIEEFTIADCELYISKYPYGEHLLDVKRHLKTLAKANRTSQTIIISKKRQRKKVNPKVKIK